MKWAQWDKTQSRELLGLLICVCIALCTTAAHKIAQNRPDNFPSYPLDNHHCSDDVYLREGGRVRKCRMQYTLVEFTAAQQKNQTLGLKLVCLIPLATSLQSTHPLVHSLTGFMHVSSLPLTHVGKVSKHDICNVCDTRSIKHSATARVNEGSHSFTCHRHVYPHMEWAILPLLPSHRASTDFGRYSLPIQHRIGGWVGLGGWLYTKVVCLSKDGHPSQY